MNVSTAPSLRISLLDDNKTRKLLELLNQEDQKVYAYAKDELWQRYIDEYGPVFLKETLLNSGPLYLEADSQLENSLVE